MDFLFRHHNRVTYPQKHILICEDDLMQQKRIVEHLSTILDPQGKVQISIVPGALMAAAIINSITVDLIILDHDLPQGNGTDFLNWMKKYNVSIPVITFSGIPQNNDNMIALGATHLFQKEEVINGKADQLIKRILQLNVGVAEEYVNTVSPNKPILPRYWITPNILVGGNLVDEEDWKHIRDTFGIEAVINVEHRPDILPTDTIPNFLHSPVMDNGTGFPVDTIREVVQFANQHKDKNIYVHCHLGFSRSPHFTYAILRACYKMSSEEALATILRALPTPSHHWGFNQHTVSYIKSIEEALTNWTV
jgi:CheY-like chemotaxis protein